MHDNAALWRADDGANEVAASDGHHPPTFFPCTDATGRPDVGELLQRTPGASRHGPKRMTDHVGRVFEDGKLLAPDEEWVLREHRGTRLTRDRTHDGCVSSRAGCATASVRDRRNVYATVSASRNGIP